jgi:hypothetical protein
MVGLAASGRSDNNSDLCGHDKRIPYRVCGLEYSALSPPSERPSSSHIWQSKNVKKAEVGSTPQFESVDPTSE